ncbi:MAG: hypothetical protein IPK32_24275 [Verrucomicrobiaceae bacterium]|nr:hypothetical protein [Verrucomicrobiaceae bacterium]
MKALSKLHWLYHRLRAMPLGEIAGRVRAKAVEAAVPLAKKGWEMFPLGAVCESSLKLPVKESAPAVLREAVRADAVRIMEWRLLLLVWKEAQVNRPPVWSRDGVHGVAIPMTVKDYRHLEGGADARCAWEIARWSEMVRLAQDAWLNGELVSLKTAQMWMHDWIEKNPVGQGIHWTSPLEGALRLMNFAGSMPNAGLWGRADDRGAGTHRAGFCADACVVGVAEEVVWLLGEQSSDG